MQLTKTLYRLQAKSHSLELVIYKGCFVVYYGKRALIMATEEGKIQIDTLVSKLPKTRK